MKSYSSPHATRFNVFIFLSCALSPNKPQFRWFHHHVSLHPVVLNSRLWCFRALKPFKVTKHFPAGLLYSVLSKENTFWQVILTKGVLLKHCSAVAAAHNLKFILLWLTHLTLSGIFSLSCSSSCVVSKPCQSVRRCGWGRGSEGVMEGCRRKGEERGTKRWWKMLKWRKNEGGAAVRTRVKPVSQ